MIPTSVVHRAAFRVDASRKMGGGHVIRCLALANALENRGFETLFVVNDEAHDVALPLRTSQIPVTITHEGDVKGFEAAVLKYWPDGCHLAIFDHYELDQSAEVAAYAFAERIVVIDDLANRTHDCDILVDATPGRFNAAYEKLVPNRCRLLVGADYALLRPEFAHLRDVSLRRRAKLKNAHRLLITLGLTDTANLAEPIARGLAGRGFEICVAIGSGADSMERLHEVAATSPDVYLCVDSPDMASLLVWADLAVGACGQSSLERCCMGVPTVSVIIAENQKEMADSLSRSGAVRLCPVAEIPTIIQSVLACSASTVDLNVISAAAASVCDGSGVRRVAEALHEGVTWRVRHARPDDACIFWSWRNRPEVRLQSIAPHEVSWPDHLAWYTNELRNENNHYFVCELEGGPAVLVRFDALDGHDWSYRLSIIVRYGLRGMGLGQRALRECIALMMEAVPEAVLVAEVKNENSASLRLFEACGFERADRAEGYVILHRAVA